MLLLVYKVFLRWRNEPISAELKYIKTGLLESSSPESSLVPRPVAREVALGQETERWGRSSLVLVTIATCVVLFCFVFKGQGFHFLYIILGHQLELEDTTVHPTAFLHWRQSTINYYWSLNWPSCLSCWVTLSAKPFSQLLRGMSPSHHCLEYSEAPVLVSVLTFSRFWKPGKKKSNYSVHSKCKKALAKQSYSNP